MNIYVGNLPYSVSEDDLRNMFAEFGEVSSANIITDRYTGQSKGFGFVEMPSQQEAEEAISNLNDSAVQGRNVKVSQARPGRTAPPGARATEAGLPAFLFGPAGVEVCPPRQGRETDGVRLGLCPDRRSPTMARLEPAKTAAPG